MEKKYRLQIDFSEEAYGELESLQNGLNAPSKSEVIRDALGVLRWVADEIHEGHRILVQKNTPTGNEVKEIVFHFIKRPLKRVLSPKSQREESSELPPGAKRSRKKSSQAADPDA